MDIKTDSQNIVLRHFTLSEVSLNGDFIINSLVSRDGRSLIYSVDGHAYIKVKQGGNGEELLRMRIDNVINSIVEEVKESIDAQKVLDIIELLEEIRISRFSIETRLLKYLRKPVFGGDCEYIK